MIWKINNSLPFTLTKVSGGHSAVLKMTITNFAKYYVVIWKFVTSKRYYFVWKFVFVTTYIFYYLVKWKLFTLLLDIYFVVNIEIATNTDSYYVVTYEKHTYFHENSNYVVTTACSYCRTLVDTHKM